MSQIKILTAVKKQHPTTVREIAETVGLSSTTVWHHLNRLKDEGKVTWESGKARTHAKVDWEGQAEYWKAVVSGLETPTTRLI